MQNTLASECLPADLVEAVLTRLGVKVLLPDLSTLRSLVAAYTQSVPWESASRINRKAAATKIADCPRWPKEFWRANLRKGHGGTCFESNYAFYALLETVGYKGYLTINNMGERIGCHTAIVLNLEGDKWLVDAGYPLYTPLPLHPDVVAHQSSAFHRYSSRPDGGRRFQIERDAHPEPNVFTLIDTPVPEAIYREATTADYEESGLFLQQVIVNKVIDGRVWRFNTGERPWQLNEYSNGTRSDHPLVGDVAKRVASHFGMDEETVGDALAITQGET